MSKPDLIPLKDMDRANPMAWDGEEPAEGVFLDSGNSGDPLALLGASAFQPREEPRLPADFEVSAALRERLQQLQRTMTAAAAGPTRPGAVDQRSTGARLPGRTGPPGREEKIRPAHYQA